MFPFLNQQRDYITIYSKDYFYLLPLVTIEPNSALFRALPIAVELARLVT